MIIQNEIYACLLLLCVLIITYTCSELEFVCGCLGCFSKHGESALLSPSSLTNRLARFLDGPRDDAGRTLTIGVQYS